jgi:polar amino acid transport system substrate-binding protein
MLACASHAFAGPYKFVTLEFPPIAFTGADGVPRGIAVDLVNKVMENLGHQALIEVVPWARGYEMARTGLADAIFTAARTPEREELFYLSRTPLITQIVSLYCAKDSTITFNGDLTSLKGKRIGIVYSISYGQTFDSVKDDLTIVASASTGSNIKNLASGRIDLLISSIFVADFEANRAGVQDGIRKLSPYIETVPTFVAFSRKSGLSELRDSFDEELSKLMASGYYTAVLVEYGLAAP